MAEQESGVRLFEERIRELVLVRDLVTRLVSKESVVLIKERSKLRDEYVRVHLMKIAAHLHSLERLTLPCCDRRVLWDVSGVGAIARAIVDASLGLAYWRDESHPEEEGAKYRLSVLHEYLREAQILQLLASDQDDQIKTRMDIVEDTKVGLRGDPIFNLQFAGVLDKAIKGHLPRLLSNEQICKRAGITASFYEPAWRMLSMHVHSHPHAISALREFRATDSSGRALLGLFLHFATIFGGWAAGEFLVHFAECSGLVSSEESAFIEIAERAIRSTVGGSKQG